MGGKEDECTRVSKQSRGAPASDEHKTVCSTNIRQSSFCYSLRSLSCKLPKPLVLSTMICSRTNRYRLLKDGSPLHCGIDVAKRCAH